MARLARSEVFAAGEVAIVHVMNRTVRRCFLLGDDQFTGKNYDHRKRWIDDQLVLQARAFGIDLLCQAIMSNHIHLVLRSRPDVVKLWDDSEVARRWLMLCPFRRDAERQPMEPNEFELNSIRNDKDKLAKIRVRLSDISWWMRLLSQDIAQRANREDEEVGKFWQARYRAVRLIDETAVLACAAYVDLNPIRAAIAETIEDSDFTSAQKRILDLEARRGTVADKNTADQKHAGSGSGQSRPPCSGRHLAPVKLRSHGLPGPDVHKRGVRCSNKGFLPISTADYLTLLDWTARQRSSRKRGSTPKDLAPLFVRLGISARTWCELVNSFGSLFSVVAGQPDQVDSFRSRTHSHRFHVRQDARKLMSPA